MPRTAKPIPRRADALYSRARMRRTLPTLVAVAACAALVASAVAFSTGPALRKPLVEQVRSTLETRYYRQLPPSILGHPTVETIIAALDDPYTAYLAPAEVNELHQRVEGRYSGIGATVTPRGSGLVVTSAPPGPARAAGVRPGDLIVTIDGVAAAQLSAETAIEAIIGPKGTAVALGVLREGDRLAFRIVRADVVSAPVRASVVVHYGRRIGLLRIYRFTVGTSERVRRAALELRAKGVTGYVLDLRSNPGGLLEEAVGVASVFLDGDIVTRINSAHEPLRVLRAGGSALRPRVPVVVVVNRYSASSSEVVAAALQENHRAFVVGEPTFGKALVQAVERLEGGAALRLTAARYLTPRGRDISGAGITPDVFAVDDPSTLANEALPEALAVLPVP